MPYCPNCGTEFPENAKFCLNCGNALPEASAQEKIEESPAPTEVAPATPPSTSQTPDVKAEETMRKLKVGEKIVKQYTTTHPNASFISEHPFLFILLYTLAYFVLALILSSIHYILFFREVENFQFRVLLFFVSFAITFSLFEVFTKSFQRIILYILSYVKPSSWLKNNFYENNKSCNSDFAFHSVYLYGKKQNISKQEVFCCRVLQQGFLVNKYTQGKASFRANFIRDVISTLLLFFPCVCLYFLSGYLFFDLIALSLKKVPFFSVFTPGIIFVIAISVIMFIVGIAFTFTVDDFNLLHVKYIEELKQKCEDAKEE